MKIRKNFIILSICFSALTLSSCDARHKRKSLKSKIDSYINAYVDQGWFSGSVLVAKDGNVVLSKGYGMANLEHNIPNTAQTKFKLASITKQFTAMAIMQLQEQGLLSVNDTVSKYIPDYPNGDKITIHHLLTHTSGIPNLNNSEYKTNKTQPQTLETRIALFKNKTLESEPGEKHDYTDNNYILLTYIIEKASSKKYETFLQEHIFNPLSMKNTGCDDGKRIIKNKASGYAVIMDGEIVNASYLDMSFEVGAGSLYSTVQDLYLWDRALYTQKLTSKEYLAQIFTPYKDNYGYGWYVLQSPYGKLTQHTGLNPGAFTIINRYVDRNVCIILLSNSEDAFINVISENLAHIVFGQKPEYPKKRAAITLPHEIYDKYTGTYVTKDKNLTFVVSNEQDNFFVEVLGHGKFVMHPESETTFFLKTADVQISFISDGSGKDEKLVVHEHGQDTVAEKIE